MLICCMKLEHAASNSNWCLIYSMEVGFRVGIVLVLSNYIIKIDLDSWHLHFAFLWLKIWNGNVHSCALLLSKFWYAMLLSKWDTTLLFKKNRVATLLWKNDPAFKMGHHPAFQKTRVALLLWKKTQLSKTKKPRLHQLPVINLPSCGAEVENIRKREGLRGRLSLSGSGVQRSYLAM